MPNDTAEDTQAAMTYPLESVYEDWKEAADEMDMTVSEWIQAMVAAGRKKFDRSGIDPDETNAELREQRNHYKAQLEEAEKRIEQLEERMASGERAAIVEHVRDNPGATYHEILQHVQDSARGRVNDLLEVLEGKEIERQDGDYYPTGGNHE